MYRQMRMWRHDYRNHLQTMKALDTPIKSGNAMADVILSSKMSLAQAHGIDVRVDAHTHIPIKLRISELDLCCVLGNLFDNAIEANDGLPEADRMIRVYMDMKGMQLYISFTNASSRAASSARSVALPHHQIRRGARFRVGPHRPDHRGCGRLPESQLRGRRLHHGDSAAAVLMTAVRAHESGLSMRVLPAGEGGSWGQSPLLGLIPVNPCKIASAPGPERRSRWHATVCWNGEQHGVQRRIRAA